MPQLPQIIEVEGVQGQCPICQHPPIRHIEDGTGATCLVCLWAQEQFIADAAAGRPYQTIPGCRPGGAVCTVKFKFRLSKHEREQAEKANKGAYEPRVTCAVCYCNWEQHSGYLCPSGDSTFVPLLDSDKPFLITK